MERISIMYGGHKWEKLNNVTLKDRNGLYDRYQCAYCGLKGKSYVLESIDISDRDIEKATKCNGVKSKKQIRVRQCSACGKAFSNLTPGSIHEIIEAPAGQDGSRGEWVMGVGEPVLLLYREFDYVED